MKTIQKSAKLNNVCYDIRGPVLEKAKQMEEDGHKIIKLNIGNLAPFGFDAPEEIQLDMIRNLPNSAGYSDSKGIFAARKAVMHYTQEQGIKNVTLDDIYLGNGASELISLATNALLDQGDELLLPAPDYPLWTGLQVHCFHADALLGERRGQARVRKAQFVTGAEYDHLRTQFQQAGEVLGREVFKARDIPRYDRTFGHDEHRMLVAHLVDFDIAVAIGGDGIENGGWIGGMELQGGIPSGALAAAHTAAER